MDSELVPMRQWHASEQQRLLRMQVAKLLVKLVKLLVKGACRQ